TERKNAMNHEIHETHEKDANRQNQLDSKQPAQSGNAIDDFSPVSGRCSFSCISWFDRFGEGPPTFPGCQKLVCPFGFSGGALSPTHWKTKQPCHSPPATRHPPLPDRNGRAARRLARWYNRSRRASRTQRSVRSFAMSTISSLP